MYVAFNEIPVHARIWVYQADRAFAPDEKKLVEEKLKDMCSQWNAHGAPLYCSFALPYDHFVLLAVDESRTGASGCSIDGSVRSLKEIQQITGIGFFNRRNLAFLLHGKPMVIPQSEFKSRWEDGTLTGDTLTFNNLVATKGDWVSGWQVPVKSSWLASLVPKSTVDN